MRIPKQFKDLAKQAKAAGWTITMTKKCHLKWTSPKGAVVISASSPGDVKAATQLAGYLRHAGLGQEKATGNTRR